MNHEWTRMHTNEDMTIGLLKVGRLNGNDSDRKLVERATGPLRWATSPPRSGGGRELFGSRVCRAKTRRQVAAENGQVGRSTQTQSNRSGLAGTMQLKMGRSGNSAHSLQAMVRAEHLSETHR